MIEPVTFRARTEADHGAIRELCVATLSQEDGSDADGLDRVLWSTKMRAVVAESGRDLVGVVVGNLFDDEGVPSAAVTVVAVDAAHRRMGIGQALLAHLESIAREAGAFVIWSGGGQPRFWWPGVDETWSDVVDFFVSAGYVVADEVSNMDVDLTRADLAERPVYGMEIRRLQLRDWPDFAKWMSAQWDDPWGDETEGSLRRSPIACHVARRDGEFVGFAAYDTNRRGWFGPMGTSPGARGTGVGAELLRRCLRDYVQQGRNSCEIGWVGPVDFYVKTVGAARGRRFTRLRKLLKPDAPIASDAALSQFAKPRAHGAAPIAIAR